MQQVVVVPFDSAWSAAFAQAARDVQAALGGALVEMFHIGSTAIPKIHAKPVIDLLAVVNDLAAADAGAPAMRALGYEVMGEFGIAGRRYFRRNNKAGMRTHQVHAFARGSPHIERHLAFRDFLRAHPALASEYGELKQQLAAVYANDIDAYCDGKDNFIQQVQAQALAWRQARP
jgi:GrpB-like predicted nucleotidyltransferase (UPF0157 family)